MQKNYLLTFVFISGLAFLVGSCQSGTKEHSAEGAGESSINYNEDLGGEPWVLDIEEATLGNENYRSANWTGKYMQLVFMTLKPGEVIDLEIHSGHDQFIRIEEGEARVQMGKTEDNLSFDKKVSDDWAILIPAGYWHTVENTGKSALKLYTLYGPAEHEKGTINKTYEEAKEAHHDHSH
jgi:mannose-6-phosphate isomerase-like protein (cupin superfamily)